MPRTHVLVISENPSMGNVLRLILQQEGHSHITTMGISDVDPVFVAHVRPDLALLDVNRMSGAQGWSVLQLLHRSFPTNDQPLVLCAPALVVVPEQERWLTARGIALLIKPVGIEQVLQAVRRALVVHHCCWPCYRPWPEPAFVFAEGSEHDAIAWH